MNIMKNTYIEQNKLRNDLSKRIFILYLLSFILVTLLSTSKAVARGKNQGGLI